MATEMEQMEAALAAGQPLGEALVTAPDAPASAPEAAPAAEAPTAPPPPDDLAPYLTAVPESLREIVRPALQTMLDGVKAKAATATEAEGQLQAMHRAFSNNPRGALQFLAEHYRVPVRFADEAGPAPASQPSPAAPGPAPQSLEAEIAAELQKIEAATNMAEVARATDRLTTLKVARQVGEAVAPVAAAQLSQEEQRQLDHLRTSHPDIPVDTLLPQIKRRQAVLRERPYLTPEEGMFIELGPKLIGEVRRLRTQLTRATTPAERAAAGVGGPAASAPAAGASFDPYALSDEQLMAIMTATGGVAPAR